jgi:hypothetical protein
MLGYKCDRPSHLNTIIIVDRKKALKKTRIKLYNTLALPVLLYGSETGTINLLAPEFGI